MKKGRRMVGIGGGAAIVVVSTITTTAFFAFSSHHSIPITIPIHNNYKGSSSSSSPSSVTNVGVSVSSKAMDKFTPRFDGLRFIETLVTAHR